MFKIRHKSSRLGANAQDLRQWRRANYKEIQQVILEKFQKTVNLIDQPDLVAIDNEIMVYSAIAFIIKKVPVIASFDTMTIDQVSALVNTGNSGSDIKNVNGGTERRTLYESLIVNLNLFKCNEE